MNACVEITNLLLFLTILFILSIFRYKNFRTGKETKIVPFIILFHSIFLTLDILTLICLVLHWSPIHKQQRPVLWFDVHKMEMQILCGHLYHRWWNAWWWLVKSYIFTVICFNILQMHFPFNPQSITVIQARNVPSSSIFKYKTCLSTFRCIAWASMAKELIDLGLRCRTYNF